MNLPDHICGSCGYAMRYDALHFTCRTCAGTVCPFCAGMDERDCDDPMPQVRECPACVEVNVMRGLGMALMKQSALPYMVRK